MEGKHDWAGAAYEKIAKLEAERDEIKKLHAIIAKGRRVVLAYLPNTGQCCGIDFKELNEFLIESTPSENGHA